MYLTNFAISSFPPFFLIYIYMSPEFSQPSIPDTCIYDIQYSLEEFERD